MKRARMRPFFVYNYEVKPLTLNIEYGIIQLSIHLYKESEKMEPHTYKVMKIEGEYATLKDADSGEELFIAMFLLPEETDIGVTLRYENLTYTVE